MSLTDTYRNWILVAKDHHELNTMKMLFRFVASLFVEIFSENAVFGEDCILYNEPNCDCPMLIWGRAGIDLSPIELRTHVSSVSLWNQYIFQFSHELTHYVIRQYKPNKNVTLRWFEETLCEAMSLYIVKLASELWDECALSGINLNYRTALDSYWRNEYGEIAPSALSRCITLADLQNIEESSESSRMDRSLERNRLVDAFIEMPEDVSDIVYYTWFMKDRLLVDFDTWKESSVDGPIIPVLEGIQPNILSA